MKTLEAIKLIEEGSCPACGPGKLMTGEHYSWEIIENAEVCVCCGRIFFIKNSDSGLELSIEMVPPNVGEDYEYKCAVEFPDHKWPIDNDNPEAEPLSEEEKTMVDGSTVKYSPYELQITSGLVGEWLTKGTTHNFRVLDGANPKAKIVSVRLENNRYPPMLVLEYDMPVPRVAEFERTLPYGE